MAVIKKKSVTKKKNIPLKKTTAPVPASSAVKVVAKKKTATKPVAAKTKVTKKVIAKKPVKNTAPIVKKVVAKKAAPKAKVTKPVKTSSPKGKKVTVKKAASKALSCPASTPVCEATARCPLEYRPTFKAIIGFSSANLEACCTKRLPSLTPSRYSVKTRVNGSANTGPRTSVSVTSV